VRGVRHGVGKLTFSDGEYTHEASSTTPSPIDIWGVQLITYSHTSIYLSFHHPSIDHWYLSYHLSIADSFYRGDFQGDQMYGKGIFVGTADNTQYDGEWKSNMRQGMGTAMDSDGRYR